MSNQIKLSESDITKLLLLENKAQSAHVELGELQREYDLRKSELYARLDNLQHQQAALMSVLAGQYLDSVQDANWRFSATQMAFVVEENNKEINEDHGNINQPKEPKEQSA